jgi:hypothetical protein
MGMHDVGSPPGQPLAGVLDEAIEASAGFLHDLHGNSQGADLAGEPPLVEKQRRKLEVLIALEVLEEVIIHRLGARPKVSGDQVTDTDHCGSTHHFGGAIFVYRNFMNE